MTSASDAYAEGLATGAAIERQRIAAEAEQQAVFVAYDQPRDL